MQYDACDVRSCEFIESYSKIHFSSTVHLSLVAWRALSVLIRHTGNKSNAMYEYLKGIHRSNKHYSMCFAVSLKGKGGKFSLKFITQ